MGRLVHTHSTYIEGLILLLKKLVKDEKIKTITPGIIKRVKSNSGPLSIKISRKVIGGYKLIARKGRSAQVIYILTIYSENQLITQIEKYI